MEWLILALTLSFAAASPLCPAYACQQHEEMVCATYFNETVSLSSNPCPQGFECRITPLMSQMTHAYETDFYARSAANSQRLLQETAVETFYCQPIADPVLEPGDRFFLSCFERDMLKVAVSGKFPVPCYYPGFEDSACTMENGDIAQCACAMDGQAYCVLTEGDSVFNAFFEECHTTMLQSTVTVWQDFAYYLIQYLSAPTCAVDTVKELAVIESGFQSRVLTTTAIDLFTTFEVCPLVTCGKLKYKTCARVNLNATSQVWYVNENACPENLICEWAEIVMAVETRLRNRIYGSFDVSCKPKTTGEYDTVKDTPIYRTCPIRNTTQTLVTPSTTRSCTMLGPSDPACELNDGSFAACVCGLDGGFHCLSSYSDSQFDDYWNLCDKEVPESEVYHWKTYGKMKQFMTIPEQCRDTLNDLQIFREADQLPNPPILKRIDDFFTRNSSVIPDLDICPNFVCSTDVEGDVCAKWNGTKISLSSDGCGDSSTCSIFHIVRKIETAQTGDETKCITSSNVGEQRNSTYNYPSSRVSGFSRVSGATGSSVVNIDNVNQQDLADQIINMNPSGNPIDYLFPFQDQNKTYQLECTRLKRPGKKLKQGSHPKECLRPGFGDEQCLLDDGSFAWCGCGMDGRHHCQVSEADREVQEFWNICSSTAAGILSYEEARFWYLYITYFTYLETAPLCAPQNFYEFQYVLQKRARLASVHLASAAAVVMAAWWLFW